MGGTDMHESEKDVSYRELKLGRCSWSEDDCAKPADDLHFDYQRAPAICGNANKGTVISASGPKERMCAVTVGSKPSEVCATQLLHA
jgi:hypothetical protein